MLYQLLTGTLPFQADSMASLMFKIANESHPDIIQIRADIPIHLKHIIDTALEKNPQARFQTGMQFAQALRDCSDEAEYAPRNELSF
jgi:serine/threonine-protein kinase